MQEKLNSPLNNVAKIPISVTSIGDYAFADCSSLASVDIPVNVTRIGNKAFGFFWDDQKKDGFTICGVSGSESEKYAIDNGFAFEVLAVLGDISQAKVELEKSNYIYDGKAETPTITVKLGESILTPDMDYTVSYSDNVNVGTASVTVTGRGNYTGVKSVNFLITKVEEKTDPSITCKKTLYKIAYGTKSFNIKASSKSELTFTSSNPKIVSVGRNTGTVIIKDTGTAVITIQAGKSSEGNDQSKSEEADYKIRKNIQRKEADC